jgi:endoglucanase
LAQDCLQGAQKQERYDLLKYAIQKLKSSGNITVYLDAGHSKWVAANDMAERLKSAGIETADGFAVNVSNFQTTDSSVAYGQQISPLVGGKHFIVDTARNGNGPAADSAWCNPAGRALGEKPTTATGNASVDGFLWLKYPGESDGSCDGAPSAGQWYPEYALKLAQSAKW